MSEQNDGHEQDYADAALARTHADRMAAGLSCLPDKERGDLDEVLKLRAELDTVQKDSLRLNLINRRDLDIGFEEGDCEVGVPSAFFVTKSQRDEKGQLMHKVIGVDPDVRAALDQAAQEWEPKPVGDQGLAPVGWDE